MKNFILEEFPDAIKYLSVLYELHRPEKDDSWRHCDLSFLLAKFREEFDEAEPSLGVTLERKELADLLLVGLMLLQRKLLL